MLADAYDAPGSGWFKDHDGQDSDGSSCTYMRLCMYVCR